MKLKLWKVSAFVLTCGLTIGFSQIQIKAAGLNAGVFAAIDSYRNSKGNATVANTDVAPTAAAPAAEDTTVCGYTNLGIAQVDSSLNIREQADTGSDIVGKMQNEAACEIIAQEGEWYQIQSGKVSGYVKAEYIMTGEDAKAKAQEIVKTIATVTTQTLNVRAEMNTECTKLALMPEGEELEVVADIGDWVQVDLDGDLGYVSKEFIELSEQLPKAQTITELKYGQGISDVRVSVVAYATQFVGNRYVWGGTSLTKGADCSGFTMSVMAKYGISLPHSSRSQANCGTRINASEAQPGDLFFYGHGNGINHVAIYIGNGQIVHASSPSTGIKISNAFYRSPVCVVRVLGN